MPFIFVKSLSGENFQTTMMLPTTASETYTEGEGLVVTGGKLTKCGATAKPTYIAAAAYVAPGSGMKDLPVYPVLEFHLYETTFAADASANAEGTLVTLHTDGAQITATATSGVATIIKKLGTGASGTKAHIRFL
jgi:aconitase A